MKFVLIDEQQVAPKVVDIEPSLTNYYKYLGCDLIQIIYRKIGGKEYLIICDEEGLLRNRYPVAITFEDGEILETLVGSILIGALSDEEGNKQELTDNDITNLICAENYRTFILQREGENPYRRRLLLTNVA